MTHGRSFDREDVVDLAWSKAKRPSEVVGSDRLSASRGVYEAGVVDRMAKANRPTEGVSRI